VSFVAVAPATVKAASDLMLGSSGESSPTDSWVEIGIGTPAWAERTPVDAGTRRVASDGLVPLYDPDGLITALAAGVSIR
jgi:hypothetical protein